MVWEVKSKRAFILENLPELVRSTVRICHHYGSFHSLLGRYFDCRDHFLRKYENNSSFQYRQIVA